MTKEPKLRCTLCDRVIWPDHQARDYAEGPFCADVGGCRRTALKTIQDLQHSLGTLRRWAEGDKAVTWQDTLDTMKKLGIERKE